MRPWRETAQAALDYLLGIEFAGSIWTDTECCVSCKALKHQLQRLGDPPPGKDPEPHEPDCEWLMTVNDLRAVLAE